VGQAPAGAQLAVIGIQARKQGSRFKVEFNRLRWLPALLINLPRIPGRAGHGNRVIGGVGRAQPPVSRYPDQLCLWLVCEVDLRKMTDLGEQGQRPASGLGDLRGEPCILHQPG
jgi:hypothetical protein